MMYLTAKSKLSNEFQYFNLPITAVNWGEHCVDCRTLSGNWELMSNQFYMIMVTNSPVRSMDGDRP